ISEHRSKSVEEFAHQNFDYVLTVCDSAKVSCPMFPGKAISLHHNFEDPAGLGGSEQARLNLFRRVRDELQAFLQTFAAENP
ncbi:MAG TPA: hypothetical protein VK687_04945, partial [Bryobacteraceae bacterium]|nr:hypothetical protein [Bryobacteraceae bacterium]